MLKRSSIYKIFCLLLGLAPQFLSGGGVCLYEISTADVRLASAGWSARAEDPSTLFTNPAGMTRLCGRLSKISKNNPLQGRRAVHDLRSHDR